MKLENKIVWITGAGSGIGRELAIQLSQKGNLIILSGRKENSLVNTLEMCQANGHLVLPLDLTQTEKFDSHLNIILDKYKKLDCLINNGGISQRSLGAETPWSVFEKIFNTNYNGTVQLSLLCIKQMNKQGYGTIATVSSIAGKFGYFYRSAYCGSKHALHGTFESLRLENPKINFTILCPGTIKTEISKNALAANGQKTEKMDLAQEEGMPVNLCVKKMIRAIEKKKLESYIGKKEILMVYIHKYFPNLAYRLLKNREKLEGFKAD